MISVTTTIVFDRGIWEKYQPAQGFLETLSRKIGETPGVSDPCFTLHIAEAASHNITILVHCNSPEIACFLAQRLEQYLGRASQVPKTTIRLQVTTGKTEAYTFDRR